MKFPLFIILGSISGLLHSQPGCDFPSKENFLIVTYYNDTYPLLHTLNNGQYLKCDTFYTNFSPCIGNIPLNSNDTIKLFIESDKVKINLWLTNGELFRTTKPAYYFIYGLPNESGAYIVNLSARKKDDLLTMCGFDITPAEWTLFSPIGDSIKSIPETHKDTSNLSFAKIKPVGSDLSKEKSDSIVLCDCIERKNNRKGEMLYYQKSSSKPYSGKCKSGTMEKKFSKGRLQKTIEYAPLFGKGRVETEYLLTKEVERVYYENGRIRQKTIRRNKTIFRKRKCVRFFWDVEGNKTKDHCEMSIW